MSWRRKSYDELPALSVRRADLRRSLRTVTAAWMFGVVWMSCIGGSHVKSFARMIGVNDLAFGIMGAVPFLATFAQLFATILIERTGLRKYQFIQTMVIARGSWLVIAAIPLFLPMPSSAAVVVLLLTLGFAWTMMALGLPAWLSWMGDLIPRRIRGRYMARRAVLSRIVQICVVLALGFILDAATVQGAPETAEAQPMLMRVTCFIFVAAAIFGVADVLLFHRIREVIPTTPDKPRPPVIDIRVPRPPAGRPAHWPVYVVRYVGAAFRQVLFEPLKDPVYRHYVCYGMAMTFALTAGGWYFWLNAMENLGFTKLGANSLFLVIGPMSGILTLRLWGRLIDRWGRRPVLILVTFGTLFSVMPWFFATRTTPHPQFVETLLNWLAGTVGGLFGRQWTLVGQGTPLGAYLLGALGCAIGASCWMGVHLAQMSVILGFASGRGRSKYVSASSMIISIGGVLGGLTAGVVTQSLHYLQASPIGPFQWINWHAAFALSLLARFAGLCLLVNMPDPGAGRVRDMVRLIGVNAYNAVTPRLFYRLRTAGWRRRGNDREKQN